MSQWQQALAQMGDVSDWPDDAKQRMSITGFIAGIDRSHLLNAILALGVIKMTVSNQKNITHRVALDGKTEAKRMGDFFNLTSKQSKKITSVITDSSNTNVWSRNLWIDSDKMAGDVQYLVNQHLKHGMSLNDLDSILANHANPSQFKPSQSAADRIQQMEFNARRIVRTESARIKDEANMATYRMKDVKQVDWVCEPGACQKCQGIEEGSPYWINDAPDIPDDSHPNCRCSKIPHIGKSSLITSSEAVMTAAQTVLSETDDSFDTAKNETRAVERDSSSEQPLPNAENAIIPIEKFTKYALDMDSPNGRNKAIVFKSALGYTKENYKGLMDQIKKGILTEKAIPKLKDGYGQRYEVNIMVTGDNGQKHNVTTAWIVSSEDGKTRFVSPYVKDKKGEQH